MDGRPGRDAGRVRRELQALGFTGFDGFLSVRDLRTERLRSVPERPGVYVVLSPGLEEPAFLTVSPAGWPKGRNPSLPLTELRRAWVHGTPVLYVGKAGRAGGRSTLRSRLRSYLAHGAGRRAAHWGGRAIWQLACAEELLVAWSIEEAREPREVEKELLARFARRFDARPFANRTG